MIEDNPFPTSTFVKQEQFCDRTKELGQLKQALKGGSHHTIVSLRRMGKTALVDHFISKYSKSRDVEFLKIDIQGTQGFEDFNQLLATAISRSYVSASGKLTSALSSFISRFRASLSVDPLTQLPTVELALGSASQNSRTLSDLVAELEKSPKRVVLAIDEVQQIIQYPGTNAESLLRSVIQPLRNVSCVFAGSRKDMMVSMFSDHRRPFYHSTEMMFLNPIDRNTYTNFICEQFSKTGRTITLPMAEMVYDAMRGHTFYVQLVCRRIWSSGQKKVNTEAHIHTALIETCKELEQEFYTYRNLLPSGQWDVLLAIARQGSITSPSSKDFLEKHKLGLPSSTLKAVKALLEKELVYRDDEGTYYAYNPLFTWWASNLT
ncbi:MAG: ATP-binding protein [Ignavibacteria bacterium]|nr:ATP-binding protein [Ignavibacteria bacterium]